jgi:hypothetical protein
MDDVEKVARALYQRRATVDSPWLTGWENAPENTRNILRGDATAAIAAMDGWRPISDAIGDIEILALGNDGAVYRMHQAPNHRGEMGWVTWCGFGFVTGYITHFIPCPALPAPPQHGGENG